jgi:hypothetical protein
MTNPQQSTEARIKEIREQVSLCAEPFSSDIEFLLAIVEELQSEATGLSVKLQRTVNAARGALLEMSAWMGIPEKKRQKQIELGMENVKYCAEHDLRHVDESHRYNELRQAAQKLRDEMAWILDRCETTYAKVNVRRKRSLSRIPRTTIYGKAKKRKRDQI